MSTWYAVYDESGEAVSFGTVLADPLPPHLSVVVLEDKDVEFLLSGKGRWDSSSLSVVLVSEDLWPSDDSFDIL